MAEVVKPAWLPEGLYQTWLGAYADAGGSAVPGAANTATEFVRSTPEYDTYFPGLRREDGSLRYAYNPEQTYFTNMASFQNAVESVGMNPDVFGDEYVDLIEGDVSPQEFQQRVSVLYDRVLASGDDIKNYYSSNFGIDMTDHGILASIMSDKVGDAVLNRQITMAEIGGEAMGRGYDLSKEFVGMLESEGMSRNEADALFGSADRMLPMLASLAARHGDPDDTFDITEFVGGAFLSDPEQQARIERLAAQEQSTFTGGAQLDYARSRTTGGMTGLEVR
jgi:hypothetical protein